MIITWTSGATDQTNGLNVWTYTSAEFVASIHRTIPFSQSINQQLLFTQSINTNITSTLDINQQISFALEKE